MHCGQAAQLYILLTSSFPVHRFTQSFAKCVNDASVLCRMCIRTQAAKDSHTFSLVPCCFDSRVVYTASPSTAASCLKLRTFSEGAADFHLSWNRRTQTRTTFKRNPIINLTLYTVIRWGVSVLLLLYGFVGQVVELHQIGSRSASTLRKTCR